MSVQQVFKADFLEDFTFCTPKSKQSRLCYLDFELTDLALFDFSSSQPKINCILSPEATVTLTAIWKQGVFKWGILKKPCYPCSELLRLLIFVKIA